MKWMTVDPGISGTGYAIFNIYKLKKWGNMYAEADADTFDKKVSQIIYKLSWLHSVEDVKLVFCEWPSNFSGTTKGQAAINSGSILKLSFLIGGIATKFNNVKLVPVQKWKGQLPKEVVQRRAEEFFLKKGFKSHAADAVGIGQYLIQENLV